MQAYIFVCVWICGCGGGVCREGCVCVCVCVVGVCVGVGCVFKGVDNFKAHKTCSILVGPTWFRVNFFLK